MPSSASIQRFFWRSHWVAVGVLFALLGVHNSIGKTNPDTPIQATVCEIVKTPAKFDHKFVSISARYDGDGIEHVFLADEACNGYGIEPNWVKRIDGEDELDAAFKKDHWGFRGKVIRATFVGRFRWRPSLRPSRMLIVQRILGVSCEVVDSEQPPPPAKLPDTQH